MKYAILVKGKIAITETVTSNKLPLPKDLGDKKNAVIKDPILSAKMISHLQSAYEHRTSLVETLFSNELFGIAQSISQNSLQLYPGTKSGILNRLKTFSAQSTISGKAGIVIELSPIVKSRECVTCTNFHHFASIIYRHIMSLASGYERCDVIADRYFDGSLKEGTRDK